MAQDNFDDEFESVSGPKDVWNPTKEKDGTPKETADPEDPENSLVGYYIDKKEGVGEHDSTVYTIERKSDGKRLSVWGTTMLNDEMNEVRLGALIKIEWKGKELTKAGAAKIAKQRNSKDSFHKWEVFVSKKDTSRISGAPVEQATARPANTPAPTSNQVVPARPSAEEDDSDLPF